MTVRTVIVGVLIGLACGVGIGVARQSPETQLERLRIQVEDNSRRISRLEDVKDGSGDVRSKIAVLEDNMFEIKWLSRSVAGALVAQMIAPFLLRRKNGAT